MKIALAQLNYVVGDVEGNTESIINTIALAKKQQADLVVFAELAVSGYPPHDLLTYPSFVFRCQEAVEKIAAQCIGIAAVVGAPTLNPDKRGKGLYNSACFLAEGKVEFIQHKALLPDYDIFDEYRYFEPFTTPRIFHYKGKKIAIAICEDIWEIGDPSLYDHQPLEELSR
ncbi:MAG: nitrilase-related carbon-nitrogen hydrolase, partial [Bacteroidota bacterium]